MIDFTKLFLRGSFPPIGKMLNVAHRDQVVSNTFTADKYKLFSDGAEYGLHLRNLKDGEQELEMTFCPAKILQGHNGFGSNDLQGVVREAVRLIFRQHGIPLTTDIGTRLRTGDYRLSQVDIAELYRMPHALIPVLCENIRRYAPSSLQAVPLERGVGVRLWPLSDSRRVLIYDKLHYFDDGPVKHKTILLAGTELESFAQLGLHLNFDDLRKYLGQGVRIETRVYGPFLRKRKLDKGSAWTTRIAGRVHREVLEEVPLSDLGLSDVEAAIASAPPSQGALIALWAAGRTPRNFATSESAYFRHRKAILANFRLDISRPAVANAGLSWPQLVDPSSLVKSAPDWARGQGFFYNPRHPRGLPRSTKSGRRPTPSAR